MRTERWELEWRQVLSSTAGGGIVVPAGRFRPLAGAQKGRVCGELSGLINSPSIVPAIQWANLEFTPLGTPTKLLPATGTTAWTAAQFYPFDVTNPWQAIDVGGANSYLLGRPVFLVSSAAGGTIASAGVTAIIEVLFQ